MMGLTFLIGFFVAAVIKLIAYAADSFDFYSSHRLELLRLHRWRQHRQKVERLVRQITVDDVMDEVREQSERDYQLASGLSQDVETDDNVLRQTTARLPWLLIGMIGGIGNSMILGNFDSTFAAHPEMALYIPLIGGTGGNVGTQSSAIVVQGLANSSLDAKNTFKQVTKEAVVALINATIISLLVYTYNFIRFVGTAKVYI